jgi:hypothetical protein
LCVLRRFMVLCVHGVYRIGSIELRILVVVSVCRMLVDLDVFICF